MTLKNILFSNKVKNTFLGIGLVTASLLFSKAVYDYTVYSNIKYIKKRLKNISIDEL